MRSKRLIVFLCIASILAIISSCRRAEPPKRLREFSEQNAQIHAFVGYFSEEVARKEVHGRLVPEMTGPTYEKASEDLDDYLTGKSECLPEVSVMLWLEHESDFEPLIPMLVKQMQRCELAVIKIQLVEIVDSTTQPEKEKPVAVVAFKKRVLLTAVGKVTELPEQKPFRQSAVE